ncbi:MAG: phosphoglucosamine mutase [Epsilonproteobacteria bacterium]|nr:phosphoglucosamine mutase [Campylobacterota bacterium]
MGLFGTDGIRGKAGEKVTALNSLKLGMAAGIYFRKNAKTNKILVGKDTRRSGYMIENALVSGLTAVGFKVIQIGPFPTPAVAFIASDMRCDAAIMISASHNPYYDNGIKFFDSEGNKLTKEDEKAIEAIYNSEELLESEQKQGKEIGRSKRVEDVIGRYIVHIKNSFPKNLNLTGIRIVIDVANGAGYKVGPTIFEELGAEVITINNNPNGFNINEACGAMHPEVLAKAVREYRADIGIALDGDADRIVVVDEKGEIVNGDHLMGALALYQKEKNRLKNNAFVTTIMSNSALDDFLAKHGIKTYRSAVGDKNVAKMMREVGANFGGEESGHIIFSDYSSTGDGILSGLQALAMMVEKNKKASEIFRPFKLYPQVKSNLEVQEKVPLEKIKGLKELQKEIEDKNIRHLFRYSGTENKIRLLLEGDNKKELNRWMQRVEEFFKKALS